MGVLAGECNTVNRLVRGLSRTYVRAAEITFWFANLRSDISGLGRFHWVFVKPLAAGEELR
jgi:hypothetical protein